MHDHNLINWLRLWPFQFLCRSESFHVGMVIIKYWN